MPSDVNAVDELDLPDLASAPEHDRARRRGSKGEQTRRAIAEAALRLFREQGYEATTMRAIAKEAGVATGNAYYYFGSRADSRVLLLTPSRGRLPSWTLRRGSIAGSAGVLSGADRRAGAVPLVRREAVQAPAEAAKPAEPVQRGVLPTGPPPSRCTPR
jgi:hypothetical protein